MTTDTKVEGATRRGILAGALGGAVLGADAVLAAEPSVDLTTPAGRLRAYILMRGALDDRLVIGFISGRYYGVVDEEIKPLYGVLGVTFARFRPRPEGGYFSVSYEVPYFTDLETGEALDRWRNPYTGEDVAVAQNAYPPAPQIFQPDLTITPTAIPPGMTATDRVVSAFQSKGDVWMTEESFTAFQAPGMPKPFRYGEVVSAHAAAADLLQPGVKRVPCQTSYTSVVSWRPWLKMGNHPGHLVGNGTGGYGLAMDELPAAWHRAAKARRPQVLVDPGGPLKALFEV
jgi:hypothetical protein